MIERNHILNNLVVKDSCQSTQLRMLDSREILYILGTLNSPGTILNTLNKFRGLLLPSGHRQVSIDGLIH